MRCSSTFPFRLAPLGRFDDLTKLLDQRLSHELIVAMAFGFQLLFDLVDRRALPRFRQPRAGNYAATFWDKLFPA
jgi:hypothetical protein